ncbi:hypothetical protein [Xanthomonas prunicola]|jgi:hypothetical protein|uniref:hypothetical protein n=1 Tax=Xanthomonas prunicola TaxID=2053930 RepID=UPI0010555C57|nr:hypothetical protein [Xanthomonas prunicola]
MYARKTLRRLAVCLALAGSAYSAVAAVKPMVPQTESECTAKGGAWTTLGLPAPDKPKVCDLKAADSGRRCTDSIQCEGECLAPPSARVGARAHGRCSTYLSNFGNVRRVSDGIVETLHVE